MKTRIFVICAILAVIASSCLVKSLHPFFKDQDVVFKKELLGTWIDQDAGNWTISQANAKSEGSGIFGLKTGDSLRNYYLLTLTNDGGVSKFIAHLFKLNGQLYVDFYPDEINLPDITSYHLVSAHSIAKIGVFKDSLNIKWFNEMWLADLFENNKIRISHETISEKDSDESYVLTASTDELQKFLIKYGNDPNAFIDGSDANQKERKEILCYTLKRVKQ